MGVNREPRVARTDVLIIGTGGAGMRAALEARAHGAEVCLLAKGPVRATHTRMSGGRYNAVSGQVADDNPDIFFENTLSGGGGINNQELAHALTHEAMDRAYDLESYGLVWERKGPKEYLLIGTGGGNRLRALGSLDEGIGVTECMLHQVSFAGVQVHEHQMLVDVSQDDNGGVAGALVFDLLHGEWIFYQAGAVIIATGGTSQLFETNSGPAINTGDGMAVAYRAGAELIDMEFMQFIPISFVYPKSIRGYTLTEPIYYGRRHYDVNGEPGKLLNTAGDRFILKYDSVQKEAGTRDILARAIMIEILEGRGTPEGGVWLEPDPGMFEDFLHERPIYSKRILENYGERAARFQEAFQVMPSALYACGGIRIDPCCRTSIPRLFAAGEAAGGVHGANRLGASSMPDIQVFGRRAGIAAASDALAVSVGAVNGAAWAGRRAAELESVFGREAKVRPAHMKSRLQDAMWRNVGPVRNRTGLADAKETFAELREQHGGAMGVSAATRVLNRECMEAIEMENMLDVGDSMIAAATARKETRGNHFRQDFPEQNDSRWLMNLVVRRSPDGPAIEERPIVKLPDSTDRPSTQTEVNAQ